MNERLTGSAVLLVDDEGEILVEMAQWLADSEIPTLSATSAEEALDTLRVHPEVRLVVTDVRMPGMNGYQFIEAVQALSDPRAWPRIIVVTGHLTPADQSRISSYGVEMVLSKPIDLEELEAAIRNALSTLATGTKMKI